MNAWETMEAVNSCVSTPKAPTVAPATRATSCLQMVSVACVSVCCYLVETQEGARSCVFEKVW